MSINSHACYLRSEFDITSQKQCEPLHKLPLFILILSMKDTCYRSHTSHSWLDKQ